jgi:hypothetical protein
MEGVPYLFVPRPLAGRAALLISPFQMAWPGASTDDRRALAAMHVLVSHAVERLLEALLLPASARSKHHGGDGALTTI